MQAIQVKYLSCTTHLPSRWKAFTDGLFAITSSDNADPRQAAEKLIVMMGWKVKISGEGRIANGDYVFTLEGGTLNG